jgi:hypothetical protein
VPFSSQRYRSFDITFNPSDMADTTTAPSTAPTATPTSTPTSIQAISDPSDTFDYLMSSISIGPDHAVFIAPPTPLPTTRTPPPKAALIQIFTTAISAPPSRQSPRCSDSSCSSNASNDPRASRYKDRTPQPLICSPTPPRPAWT